MLKHLLGKRKCLCNMHILQTLLLYSLLCNIYWITAWSWREVPCHVHERHRLRDWVLNLRRLHLKYEEEPASNSIWQITDLARDRDRKIYMFWWFRTETATGWMHVAWTNPRFSTESRGSLLLVQIKFEELYSLKKHPNMRSSFLYTY